MSKRRKAGEWVALSLNSGFVGESDRLRVQIIPEQHGEPDGCMVRHDPSDPILKEFPQLCCDPACCEWSNVLTEPDPQNGGIRHGLYHVSECQMHDCDSSDLAHLGTMTLAEYLGRPLGTAPSTSSTARPSAAAATP